jgi:hypothetical protein
MIIIMKYNHVVTILRYANKDTNNFTRSLFETKSALNRQCVISSSVTASTNYTELLLKLMFITKVTDSVQLGAGVF